MEKDAALDRLKTTLEEYFDAIPRQNEPNPPDLMAIFARLDAAGEEIDGRFPAQLRHYVHQKSYRKAYLFLQGREEENLRGSCGR